MIEIKTIKIDGIGTATLGVGSYNGGLRAITPKATAINFFKHATLESIGVFDNKLGLFSVSNDIVNNKVVFMSFAAAQFGIRPNVNVCQWDPQLKATNTNGGFKLFPLKGQLEQCADELMGSCFRSLLGKGTAITDILATAESQLLFANALGAVFEGIGFDIDVLMWMANHPLILAANAAGVSGFDDETAKRFFLGNYNVVDLPSGFLTLFDGLKSKGIPNYNGTFDPAKLVGTKYIGDALADFQELKSLAPSKFRIALNKKPGRGIILASRNAFDRAAQMLGVAGMANGNSDLLKAYLMGAAPEIGYTGEMLTWGGHTVIPMDIWDTLDQATRTRSVRMALVHVGNLGVGFDVQSVDDVEDIGMDIEQRKGPGPDALGKIYGNTMFEIGFGVIDPGFITYKEYTTPMDISPMI